NGTLLPKEDVVLHCHDLSILRGYGLFDFFLVRDFQPLFLEDYLDRFEASARFLRLPLAMSRQALRQAIEQLIACNGRADAAIRLVLTGGYSMDGYRPAEPNFLILEHPYPARDERAYQQGVRLLSFPYVRTFPTVKTTNYAVGIHQLPRLQRAGAVDVLFHQDGWLSETQRANFFIVAEDGVVATPAEGILRGVTRKQVLALARQRFPVEERPVHMEELKRAREAFLTSSTKGVLPVVQVDDIVIGDGKPGPCSQTLGRAFQERVEAYVKNPSESP
ncbi:MAG: amino acid aminotransferase, partial [Bacteroidetes bacterium]